MTLSRFGKLGLLFGALALAGCKYEIGTSTSPLPTDLTCTSDVLDQTLTLRQGENLYSYKTNTGEPFYGLTRTSEDVTPDKAVTTTVKTEVKIRMYDHDRWRCTNPAGQAVDYKSPGPA